MTYISGVFGVPFSEAAKEENMTLDANQIALLYSSYQLVRLTGWTMEYIDRLGLLTAEAFLQFADAEAAIVMTKAKLKR